MKLLKCLLLALILMVSVDHSLGLDLRENVLKILADLPEDGRLNFTELSRKYGFECHEYEVVTEDKYVLTLFNIPGNRSRPVFLMHGFLDSADTFIIRGNGSMSIAMRRDRGDDIWIGNMRGNKYSRKHLTLNPDKDKKFWDFSFHEIAYYDLPAMIDFILKMTGQTQLQAIGHSEGTTIFYVLTSTRPEYNDKIKIFISLAPIAYLQNTEGMVKTFIRLGPLINDAMVVMGKHEMLNNYSAAHDLMRILCAKKTIGYLLCADNTVFEIDASDVEEIEADFVPIMIGHYPDGSSRKNGVHLYQVALNKRFAQYNYGLLTNIRVYRNRQPPEYDLSKITMKVALIVAKNDRLSTIPDTELLRSKLQNVVEYRVMERDQANHVGFVWAKHMYRDLFPYVFQLLEQHY